MLLDFVIIFSSETPVMSLTNNPMRNIAVETVGFYLYGIYVFASMIVLLNLLIAVMSNTFNEVQVGLKLYPCVCLFVCMFSIYLYGIPNMFSHP